MITARTARSARLIAVRARPGSENREPNRAAARPTPRLRAEVIAIATHARWSGGISAALLPASSWKGSSSQGRAIAAGIAASASQPSTRSRSGCNPTSTATAISTARSEARLSARIASSTISVEAPRRNPRTCQGSSRETQSTIAGSVAMRKKAASALR